MIELATSMCAKCGRVLRNPTESGYGPKCERAVLGRRSSRRRGRAGRFADPRQIDWAQEVSA